LTFVNSNGFCRYHWKLHSVYDSGLARINLKALDDFNNWGP